MARRDLRIKVAIGCIMFATAIFLSACRGPTGPNGQDAFVPDSLIPVVEWLEPDVDVTVDSLVILRIKAFDRIGLDDGSIAETFAWRISFFIAGDEFAGSLEDSARKIYSYRWNAARYPEAPYPLSAKVWDVTRNTASTPTIVVWVRH